MLSSPPFYFFTIITINSLPLKSPVQSPNAYNGTLAFANNSRTEEIEYLVVLYFTFSPAATASATALV